MEQKTERMAMNLQLDPMTKAALIRMAAQQDRSQAAVIRRLIRAAALRELGADLRADSMKETLDFNASLADQA